MPVFNSAEKTKEFLSMVSATTPQEAIVKEYLISLLERDSPLKIEQQFENNYVCPSCHSLNNMPYDMVLDDFCPVCGQRLSNN